MRYIPINNRLFSKNRQKLIQKLPDKSLTIFNSNDLMPTNADGIMGFKQNSDLFYLSGIDQEETILIIEKINEQQHTTYLFVRETNEHIKIWEGDKLTQAQATALSGIENVYWTKEFETILPTLVEHNEIIFYNSNEHARATKEVTTRDDRFFTFLQETHPHKRYEKVAPILHDLRYHKEPEEIAVIQQACTITGKAFRRILPFINAGKYEYEVEAEITHEFLVNRSRGHAYQPIIASGADACVLHYIENNKAMQDGALVLMDFGAEYANYASDLTRTVPVSGRYSPRQKAVYNATLSVMKQAISLLKVGTTFVEYNTAVGNAMEKELVDLGLLTMNEIHNQDPKNPAYKKYFMHGTSHSLGLDVHDVDNRALPFAAGMVFTCEPGIYIPEEEIGVRIENDILITEEGNTDLMKSIPIEIEEIEALMNRKKIR